MSIKYCECCERNVNMQMQIGCGTLILCIITCGLWLPFILFYSKQCPICRTKASLNLSLIYFALALWGIIFLVFFLLSI